MSDNLRLYTSAVFGLDARLRAVPADAWDNPSPCAGWSARDVAGHAMAVVNGVAARLGAAEGMDPFTAPAQIAGEDPYRSWHVIRDRTLEALDHPGTLRRMVLGLAGDVPMDTLLRTLMGDALVHSWDIARATGGDERLDPDLVAVAHEVYRRRHENGMLRVNGRFGEAAPLPAGAPDEGQAALLAFLGRQV
jgi:uncharacterized protein (TIGR03086 family)